MEPWVSEKWWVSPFNFADEVQKSFKKPSEVIFHDVTLRDGEQTPGVVFRKNEKIEIAKMLDEIGIQRIEAGMPLVSEEDAEAIKSIAHENLKAKVFGFARLLKEDIDAVLKCDASGIICEGPVGTPKLKQYGWAKEEIFSRAISAIDYAKAHGLYTVFFGVDTSRAEAGLLIQLLKRLEVETKVDGFAIVDTYGCCSPEGFGYLVRMINKEVKKTLEVHCHNDMGLGVACTISGILNGAQVAHTSINGIGERSGNASFEETALCLKLLYGIPLNIKFEKLYELSKLVEKYSCFPLSPNKPIVGDRVFTREAGIGVAAWLKYRLGSEAFLPELVGNKEGVVLGKKSGKHSVEWKLKQMNLQATEDEVINILNLVKKLGEEKKRALTDEEFLEIYSKVKASKS